MDSITRNGFLSVVAALSLCWVPEVTLAVDCNACGYSCKSKCKKKTAFGSYIEPVCFAGCEKKKKQCVLTGALVNAHMDIVRGKCANARGRMDYQHKFAAAKQKLIDRGVFEGILTPEQIKKVKFRWCNINRIGNIDINSAAITLSSNRVIIDDNSRGKSVDELIPLVAHELYHTHQFRKWGRAGFQCRYGAQMIKGKGTGRSNSVERPAYEFEDKIRRFFDNSYCLDVHSPELNMDGGKVQIYGCHGGQNQHFKFVGKTIRTTTGKCLDVHAPDMNKNGAHVQIWSCTGMPNQEWHIDNGRLVNGGGLCLDVHAPQLHTNGGKVQMHGCHYGQNQQFAPFGRELISGKTEAVKPSPPNNNNNNRNRRGHDDERGPNDKYIK